MFKKITTKDRKTRIESFIHAIVGNAYLVTSDIIEYCFSNSGVVFKAIRASFREEDTPSIYQTKGSIMYFDFLSNSTGLPCHFRKRLYAYAYGPSYKPSLFAYQSMKNMLQDHWEDFATFPLAQKLIKIHRVQNVQETLVTLKLFYPEESQYKLPTFRQIYDNEKSNLLPSTCKH